MDDLRCFLLLLLLWWCFLLLDDDLGGDLGLPNTKAEFGSAAASRCDWMGAAAVVVNRAPALVRGGGCCWYCAGLITNACNRSCSSFFSFRCLRSILATWLDWCFAPLRLWPWRRLPPLLLLLPDDEDLLLLDDDELELERLLLLSDGEGETGLRFLLLLRCCFLLGLRFSPLELSLDSTGEAGRLLLLPLRDVAA